MSTIEKKSFVEVQCKALEETPEWPHGGFEAQLSTDDLDRDGEVIDFKALEPLAEYWPALADHDAKIASTVGWGVPSYEDGKLMFRGPFDPDEFSQLVRSKLKSGSIRKMSVGFRNAVRKMVDGVPHVTSAEGLEGSFVVIPANPNADVTSVKQYGSIEAPAGSFEETQESVLQALRTYYGEGDCYVYLIATFTDHAVYNVCHWPTVAQDGTYFIGFTSDADGELALEGEPQAVEIEQVITPKAFDSWTAKSVDMKAKARALVERKTETETETETSDDTAHDQLIDAELIELELDLEDIGESSGADELDGLLADLAEFIDEPEAEGVPAADDASE